MSLIRSILLACESVHAGSDPDLTSLCSLEKDEAIVMEHVALLAEAGLLNVIDTSTHDGENYLIRRLTWEGHEFLESVRDNGVWEKAKEYVLKPGATWTFEVLKEWAKHQARERLGLPI